MAIRNNALSMYQDQKKKNSLQPYLDAGNASTQPKTEATRVSPTYTPNTVAKAYSAPKTASTAVPLQSAVAKAYNQPAQQSVPAQTAQNVPKATASMTTPTQNTNTPTLQQAYGNTGSYGSARQNALNQAEASYNKLLNYLPEYSELLGMRGLGVSNQALLNAYGTYQQNVNDINATYDEMEQAYRDTQISNVNTLSAELSAYINDAGENFTQEGYERFKQGMLQAGYTAEELAAAENLLTQSDRNIMNNANNNSDANKSYISNIEKPFEYNGKYYQIESKLDKNANQIVRNNDFKKQLKDMGYSNLFDENIPNGTTIITHVDNRGSNDFNWWDDVGAFLLSPFGAGAWDSWGNWNEISMTYYDGDWYLSKVVSV